jgi:hypothetical protein
MDEDETELLERIERAPHGRDLHEVGPGPGDEKNGGLVHPGDCQTAGNTLSTESLANQWSGLGFPLRQACAVVLLVVFAEGA